MNFVKLLFVPAFALGLGACSSGTSTKPSPTEASAAPAAGGLLVQTNCATCHGLGEESTGMAPKLEEVRRAWLTAYSDKEAFVQHMADFLAKPSAEKSKMPEAVEAYGLMPAMGYSKQQQVEVAEWLFAHSANEALALAEAPASKTDRLDEGRRIALATKAALGKRLMAKMKEGGPLHAIEFCTLHALPITDSVAQAEGVEVRRISDKPRNPLNAADQRERMLLESWKAVHAEGKEISAELQVRGNRVLGYYPIITEEKCMACHGIPGPELAVRLQDLYPQDQATGYEVNQVRGAFRVGFSME